MGDAAFIEIIPRYFEHIGHIGRWKNDFFSSKNI